MSFSLEKIELYIIKNLLQSDTYMRNYGSKLKPDYFSPDVREVIQGIMAFYRKNGKAPPVAVLHDMVLPKFCKSKDKLDQAVEIVDSAMAIDIKVEDTLKFVQDETKKFIKVKSVMKAFSECVDLVPDATKHDVVVKTLEEAFRINFDESLGLDYFADL